MSILIGPVVNNLTSGISFHLIMLLFLLLTYGSRLCNLGVVYPWPLAIWVVAVLISVHYRLALQRRVFGIITIPRLVFVSFMFSILLGTVHAFIVFIIDPMSDVWDFYNLMFWIIVVLCLLFEKLALMVSGEEW